MPQATEALRKRWNGPDDRAALQHLRDRGFTLTASWDWVPPPGYVVGEDDLSAIEFMAQEYDTGGLLAGTQP